MEHELIIAYFRALLKEQPSAEARKALFDLVMEGWCQHCGGPSPCNCWNDE